MHGQSNLGPGFDGARHSVRGGYWARTTLVCGSVREHAGAGRPKSPADLYFRGRGRTVGTGVRGRERRERVGDGAGQLCARLCGAVGLGFLARRRRGGLLSRPYYRHRLSSVRVSLVAHEPVVNQDLHPEAGASRST